jgi:serine/threonine protein kinase
VSYAAPEKELRQASLSSAFDIWSLGCLYLDFMTWILCGSRYKHRFAVRRTQEMSDLNAIAANVTVQEETFYKLIISSTESGEAPTTIPMAVVKDVVTAVSYKIQIYYEIHNPVH